jgi:hypothetical protein
LVHFGILLIHSHCSRSFSCRPHVFVFVYIYLYIHICMMRDQKYNIHMHIHLYIRLSRKNANIEGANKCQGFCLTKRRISCIQNNFEGVGIVLSFARIDTRNCVVFQVACYAPADWPVAQSKVKRHRHTIVLLFTRTDTCK